jgi:hypothetical protein
LLAFAGAVLLLARSGQLVHNWRQALHAFDLQVQAALAREPVVTGHLGQLHGIKRMVSAERRHSDGTMSYRLYGDAGNAIAIVRFDRTTAPRLHIVQGLLRTSDGIAYPLVDAMAPPGLAGDDAGNDPLKPRLEYVASGDMEMEAPDVVIDVDSPTRSDLDLIQGTRRRLIAPLARTGDVLRIYSMGRRADEPVLSLQLDRERMTALKLDVQDVRDALQAIHFRPLPVGGGKEIYVESGTQDGQRPPIEILSSLTIKPAHAPAVPLARIARLAWGTDESRQALGLVTSRASRADPAGTTARITAAMAGQVPTDMRIDVHAANQLRVRLFP